MTHLFAQRYTSSCSPNSASVGGVSGPPQPQPLRFQQHNIANAAVASSPRWGASHYNKMDTPSFHPAAEHSSPVAGSSSLDRSSQEPTLKASASASVGSEGGQYLPPQVFSSPTDHTYPASTLAAVEATRARFFARHARGGSHTAPRSRATPTGTTTLPMSGRRTHKAHAFSTSAGSYRQSFFERCQRAMEQSRAAQRAERVLALRKGADAFTPGILSDDMDLDLDGADSTPSSPPPACFSNEHEQGQEEGEAEGGEEREEDDELTRRRILAEYSRLKRIYELKGHLEIGWIDPDQLSWLEAEMRHQDQAPCEPQEAPNQVHDPYWLANDDELEQLWRESLSQPPLVHTNAVDAPDASMMEDKAENEMHDDFYDPAFEEALARLPV